MLVLRYGSRALGPRWRDPHRLRRFGSQHFVNKGEEVEGNVRLFGLRVEARWHLRKSIHPLLCCEKSERPEGWLPHHEHLTGSRSGSTAAQMVYREKAMELWRLTLGEAPDSAWRQTEQRHLRLLSTAQE
jgi:hypothetical protein